jgi:hypothetical protein
MKKYLFIFIILMIFTQTGNVLSSENIFIVNNIKINNSSIKNRQELINKSFKKGFIKLNQKILLKKDFEKVKNTDLKTIKNLISHYQIQKKNNQENINITEINIYFKKDKIYNFFYNNNLKYSDISEKELKIFPIIIEENDFIIFDNNYLYKNWINTSQKKNSSFDLIDYILPLENIEIIDNINNYKENLELIKLEDLFDEHINKDNLFIIVDNKNKETKIFIKGMISSNKVIKNIIFNNNEIDKEKKYNEILIFLKEEIFEIVKSQNIIDVRTPSFFNIKLTIKKQNDLIKFQNILREVDLIENYYVNEFSQNSAFIKIKFYGKINKITDKLSQKGININVDNEKWEASLR